MDFRASEPPKILAIMHSHMRIHRRKCIIYNKFSKRSKSSKNHLHKQKSQVWNSERYQYLRKWSQLRKRDAHKLSHFYFQIHTVLPYPSTPDKQLYCYSSHPCTFLHLNFSLLSPCQFSRPILAPLCLKTQFMKLLFFFSFHQPKCPLLF